MKNLFFVLIGIVALTSCSKILPTPGNNNYQEFGPDVRANLSIEGSFAKGVITRVGYIAVLNTNNIQTKQNIYSVDIALKNFEGAIDSVYWVMGTQSGRTNAKSTISIPVNQSITNGQSTTSIMIGVKRSQNDLPAMKLVEIYVEKISANFNGNTQDVVPLSQKYQTLSFSVN